MKEQLKTDKTDTNSTIDPFYTFIIAMLVLSLVLALKRVLNKRRQGSAISKAEKGS